VLSQFIKEKNELKEGSFESKLFEAVKNLIKEKKGEQKQDAYEFSHEDVCTECRNVMDGKDIAAKPQSFYTVDFGAVSHKKITETYRSKFKAKPHQTRGGEDNKRCLLFSREVLDRIGLYYDNPENIEILCDDVGTAASTLTIRNEGSDTNPNQSNGVTDVTDYNDKQAAVSKQDIPATSNQNDSSPEKQSVTDVTNITDPNDAKAPDKTGAAGNVKGNIENNSNNIDKIPNSYNNTSNNLATAALPSSANTPSLSSRCVTSVTPLPKRKIITLFEGELDGLPTLSCLFCSTYKTKIRFDMELHLFEKHKQNLVYDLPIGERKASIDDRIEYALQLIEQGKIILPNHHSEDIEGEE
jgi:hypothetical protein